MTTDCVASGTVNCNPSALDGAAAVKKVARTRGVGRSSRGEGAVAPQHVSVALGDGYRGAFELVLLPALRLPAVAKT